MRRRMKAEQVAREACFFQLKTCQVLVDIHGFVMDIMNRVMRWSRNSWELS